MLNKDVMNAVASLLSERHKCVFSAPPGTGKTTRIPLHLLNRPEQNGKILLLEPRRLAAKFCAEYMAEKLGENCGETVGYLFRGEKKISGQTRLEVITEGILTRYLLDDMELNGVQTVIFDEFHERSIHADMGLALCLEIQESLRPDLEILVMSATLNRYSLEKYFCDVEWVTADAVAYPVETHFFKDADHKNTVEKTVMAVKQALRDETGDILVFLPGESEIKRTAEELESFTNYDIRICPLYSRLSKPEQNAAVLPDIKGRRKVVLATTIAETSLTIEGIRAVIDSGVTRRSRFDVRSGMSQLETVSVSLASADQRRGRAGRLGPGVCYRLWSREKILPADYPPEILDTDLAQPLLLIKKWGVAGFKDLKLLDIPAEASEAQAELLLKALGAVDAEGKLTELGMKMSGVSLHPRFSAMLFKCAGTDYFNTALWVAALLNDFTGNMGSARRIDDYLYDAVKGQGGPAIKRVRDAALNLAGSFDYRLGNIIREDMLGLLVSWAFPDRIAMRRKDSEPRYLLSNGKGVRLPQGDILGDQEFLAVAQADISTGDGQIYLAAALNRETLLKHFKVSEEFAVEEQPERKTLRSRSVKRYMALTIQESSGGSLKTDAIAQFLTQKVLDPQWDNDLFGESLLKKWQRIQWLHGILKEEFPFGRQQLSEKLPELIEGFLNDPGAQWRWDSLAWNELWEYWLGRENQQRLNQEAPKYFTTPAGTEISIDYSLPQPAASVKLQELFGLMETPKLAGGKIPLLIHLLSPASRPIQVTSDLRSFWQQTYAEVRKELKGRYIKHYWPEDPMQAEPIQGSRLRRPQKSP